MLFMETMECGLFGESRLKALSAITSPPFIGNVMASLVGLNHAEERERLDEALIHFGRLFPYLSGSSEFVPLKEELCFIKHYFHILEMRYGERFGFGIRAEDDSREIRRFELFEAAESLIRKRLDEEAGFLRISIECRCTDGDGRDSSVRLKVTGTENPSIEVINLPRL